MDGACIVRYLQQPREYSRFIVANMRCLGFQAYVSLIRQSVWLPPRLTSALSGERHHVLALGRLNLVEVTKVADVSEASSTLPGLEPGDFRRRDQYALCDLLHGETGFCPQGA
jgi:hypothetical protein